MGCRVFGGVVAEPERYVMVSPEGQMHGLAFGNWVGFLCDIKLSKSLYICKSHIQAKPSAVDNLNLGPDLKDYTSLKIVKLHKKLNHRLPFLSIPILIHQPQILAHLSLLRYLRHIGLKSYRVESVLLVDETQLQ